LWGEREQAMHCHTSDIELLCSSSFTSEVGHSTQAMHAWHVAKMRFVTLLSTKVVKLTLAG